MASPGERLEGDPQSTLGSSFAEFMEVSCRPLNSAKRIRRDVAAHHQEVAAEFLHDVKFALGAGEHLRALWLGHTLKISERLEGDSLKPEPLDHAPGIGRSAVEGQEIVLEDLHALELRSRDGFDLLWEGAAQADGGNSSAHARRSVSSRVVGVRAIRPAPSCQLIVPVASACSTPPATWRVSTSQA